MSYCPNRLKIISPVVIAFVTAVLALYAAPLWAAGILYGRVTDPLGNPVPGAHITLLYKSKPSQTAASASDGTFTFLNLASGRYSLRVQATGFTGEETEPAYISPNSVSSSEVVLRLAPLKEETVVDASGAEVPQAQAGASVSILDRSQLENEDNADLLESLRQISGIQVVQTGQYGSAASLFVRGGNPEFNKVLIDGVPANDIGGAIDFGSLANAGVEKVEMMKGANSALYGTDAMESAVAIVTPRGTSSIPELRYFGDGGTFHTSREITSLAGALDRFDYYGAFSRFDSQNNLPNDSFHNATSAGNFGFGITTGTTLRLTLRNISTNLGLPGPYDFYGTAEDSSQKQHNTYAGLTLQNQTTASWHSLVRIGGSELRYAFANPASTGTPYSPFGSGLVYLGQPVTITGANGYSATGQAIMDYGGTYPETFAANTKRRSLFAQSDYRLSGALAFSAGFRYEHESGWTDSGTYNQTERRNYSYFLESRGNYKHRAFASLGVGLEDNAGFGKAATPRVSGAYYFRKPSPRALIGATKWSANFGTGLEEPSILSQDSSLLALLSASPATQPLISRFGISAIGPERSRSFDVGLDQGLWRERAHFAATFFDNRFYDLSEFVHQSALPLLGVSSTVAAASGFGAAINSGAYRAKGIELQGGGGLSPRLRIGGSYTYLDAVVTQSFSSSALGPSFNPNIPGIPIGAFAPLVGGRPFRRAPNTASVTGAYAAESWGVNLTGYFAGRSDDSTYLSDAFSGNTLLLPNRNLDPAYARLDLSAHLTTGHYSTFFATVDNFLNRHYSMPIGYPALPLTFRSGVELRIGGEKPALF